MITPYHKSCPYDETIKEGTIVKPTKEYVKWFGHKRPTFIGKIIWLERRLNSNPLAHIKIFISYVEDKFSKSLLDDYGNYTIDVYWVEKASTSETLALEL